MALLLALPALRKNEASPMMGSEYFTVAGYFADGAIVCRECGDRQALPVSEQVTTAQLSSDFGQDGLYCDSCGVGIVPESDEED